MTQNLTGDASIASELLRPLCCHAELFTVSVFTVLRSCE